MYKKVQSNEPKGGTQKEKVIKVLSVAFVFEYIWAGGL